MVNRNFAYCLQFFPWMSLFSCDERPYVSSGRNQSQSAHPIGIQRVNAIDFHPCLQEIPYYKWKEDFYVSHVTPLQHYLYRYIVARKFVSRYFSVSWDFRPIQSKMIPPNWLISVGRKISQIALPDTCTMKLNFLSYFTSTARTDWNESWDIMAWSLLGILYNIIFCRLFGAIRNIILVQWDQEVMSAMWEKSQYPLLTLIMCPVKPSNLYGQDE